MSITEDDLANAVIDRHRQLSDLWKIEFAAYPEVHYNHYGNRGVADLYIVKGNNNGPNAEGLVYELKSEYAVRESTGANAIIRQFNKMREFFFEGSSHSVPDSMLRFTLAFAGTPYNLRHIYDNIDMYESAVKQPFHAGDSVSVDSAIQLNDPEELAPVVVLGGQGEESTNPMAEEGFVSYLKSGNDAIFERCESVAREIAETASADS